MKSLFQNCILYLFGLFFCNIFFFFDGLNHSSVTNMKQTKNNGFETRSVLWCGPGGVTQGCVAYKHLQVCVWPRMHLFAVCLRPYNIGAI